jgi:hypothetical protein
VSQATRSVVTAVLAALVAVMGIFGLLPLAGVSVAVAVTFAVGWPALADLPDRAGSSVVIALTGIGGVGAVYATGIRPDLRAVGIVVSAAVLLTFVNELLRRDGRPRLVESMSGTVAGAVLASASAGWVACGRSSEGETLVVAAAAALAVAAATAGLAHLKMWLTIVAVVLVGAVGGAAVGFVLSTVGPLVTGLAGLGVGLLVAALHALFHPMVAAQRRLPALAMVVLPVSVAGVLVYVADRVLIG